MEKIGEIRRRLAALTASGATSSAESSLAACRSLQEQLRELKSEVLAQILALRAQAHEHATRSLEAKPSIRDLLARREEKVSRRLEAAVEAWSGLNREIDDRLRRLSEVEHKLTAAGPESAAAAPRAKAPAEAEADKLYSSVGAAVRQGHRGPFCPHCGRGVATDDRFCRHCGHRLS